MSPTGKKVLIVDDEADVRAFVEVVLDGRVAHADSGARIARTRGVCLSVPKSLRTR